MVNRLGRNAVISLEYEEFRVPLLKAKSINKDIPFSFAKVKSRKKTVMSRRSLVRFLC